MPPADAPANLADQVADTLRTELMHGAFAPGQRLSESTLCERLGVSRNTLREAFRLLTKDGLLTHTPNRGVFVGMPSMAAIIDIYRVRRMVECHAMAQAYPLHPAKKRMRSAVEQALAAREVRDWNAVGSSNMDFHMAVVELADSERTNTWFAQVLAELRLAFGLMHDPEFLHAPYVDRNQEILELVLANQFSQAAQALHDYLTHSERIVLAVHARQLAATKGH
ncbi:GntR family transcriptional regulator [Comamonas serinivorans]|uniref:GntR family transcriptional regulator n=1 Tax=Comamonas serinivorans TaxID=1082851 RepID=A0A1Y0EPK2_9BURK|nr:GntR family transcriptional regulator [Comamonas serinivorans]ARU05229.1 GntR family transcriptional regulator [Comamonas serinivorans]